MLLDHIHFNVHNANITGDWFIEKMGFQPVSQFINNQTLTRILTQNNSIFFFISSALNISSPVYNYLNSFASGVVDVAFKVKNIDAILNNLSTLENQILNTPYTYIFPEGKLKIAKIKGWNSLEHTLIENNTNIPFAYLIAHLPINNKSLNIENNLHCQSQLITNNNYNFTKIDHLVLNVSQGKLKEVATFYQNIFGLKECQEFNIKTDKSGLSSKVLKSPNNSFYFNINEPTSWNSQIQEFIDFNGGSGIQHIALNTTNILNTVTKMRSNGVEFLPVAKNYYTQLQKYGRNGMIPNLTKIQWQEIEKLHILIDCYLPIPESLLMQIFTQPIFDKPTFFFELIERRKQAQGFGKGNFQELFELIEKQQINLVY